MKLQNKLLTLAMILFTAVCSVTPITSYARQERSEKAKDSFKYSHPCPSNGNKHGACPGYVIDHITALACGGADDPSNMQWQSVAEGKAKNKWERKGCESGKKPANDDTYSGYHTGKRGGCFTYSASGELKTKPCLEGFKNDSYSKLDNNCIQGKVSVYNNDCEAFSALDEKRAWYNFTSRKFIATQAMIEYHSNREKKVSFELTI